MATGLTIKLTKGDITKLRVDAIVNAANESLLGGGGVDGAIHRAGGPEILAECKKIGHCPTGEAVITTAGRLQARFVIHTVGPIWRGGTKREAELLASCYQKSLELALGHGCKSIAFPNISTGVYGYPKEKAARIAIRTVQEFGKASPPAFPSAKDTDLEVLFCVFDEENFAIYQKLLA